MRTIVIVICSFFISTISFAQRSCASTEYTAALRGQDPSFPLREAAIENFILQQPLQRGSGQGASVIRIPVVVHILYATPGQQLDDARVHSQIEALNRDFNRLNADTAGTPAHFRALAADVELKFELATADPLGRPTTGIVRYPSQAAYFREDDRIKFAAQGGADAWDSRYYLNIWVGNLQSAMGYATAPGAPADRDGVVITTAAFGTTGVQPPFHLGRTAVHEVGHWLGLRHIWGDTYCGDDGVQDTPVQGNFTPGCPSGYRSSCNNAVTGDMYMNYMDYTADACMNLFTEGQKSRMRALFLTGGPRNSMLLSKGLSTPWVAAAPLPEAAPAAAFRIYPNPARQELNLQCSPDWIGKTLMIYSCTGALVQRFTVTATTAVIPLDRLQAGMYFIEGDGGTKIRSRFIRL